ncbi:TUBGCP5 family protein [Megaselia abdita]
MSGNAYGIRQSIIQKTVPELIKSLTGFTEDEDNFRECEEFAFSKFRNSRWLSVNSHSVKRQIAGVQERLEVESLKEYGDHLGKLCDDVVNHPICKKHYELDIGWAIVEFLIAIARNPVKELRANGAKIIFQEAEQDEESEDSELEALKEDLRKDFIECKYSDDSELSEWSDEESERTETPNTEEPVKIDEVVPNKYALKPPEPECPYKVFDGSKSLEFLLENCQHSWWIENPSHFEVKTDEPEANFALALNESIKSTSFNLIKVEELSTYSEYALMREMIWMFFGPVNCAFFEIKEDKISVRSNVTIPSVSQKGLKMFLEQNFIPYFAMSKVLKDFHKSIYSNILTTSSQPPKTYECYAASMKALMEPLLDKVVEWEDRIRHNKPYEVNTILQMFLFLKKDFKFLEQLFSLHMDIALDFNDHPPHILTTYMLSGFLKAYKTASSKEETNVAVTLFLTTVKVFFHIMDIWWSEGRLDDWMNEFIVEKINSEHEEITLRLFEKDKEKNFFVPEHVSKQIVEDDFLQLLISHSMEAAYTLNFLYEIGKITQLSLTCNFDQNLYETFMEDFWASVYPFSEAPPETLTPTNNSEPSLEPEEDSMMKFVNYYAKYEPDEFLLAAFACNSEKPEEDDKIEESKELSSLEIYEKLQNLSEVSLPLQEIILKSISKILSTRISVSNRFVIKMFKEDFQILKHLQNIRKVLLMEACDIMHFFNTKLFQLIESGKVWANTFTLSRQLEDSMTQRYPDTAGKYQVEILSSFRSKTTKVLSAINEIKISYNLDAELEYIITNENIDTYNEVFRFLLKVKWGIWTLENMDFPLYQKRRRPYSRLEMPELIMRRLEQLRFWVIYALQSIHYHLMTYVLQDMGEKVDKAIENCENLIDMKKVHNSYVTIISDHCFIRNEYMKNGIEQILNLVVVLKEEWKCSVKLLDGPAYLDTTDSSNGSITEANYLGILEHVDNIEKTYVVCHEHIAKGLSEEIYVKQNNIMSGLGAAFLTSMPC